MEAEYGRAIDHDEIYRRQRRYNAEHLAGVDSRPGVRELVLAAADADVPLAVASNAPVWWIETRLDSLGLRGFFRHLVGVDVASKPKPDPAPFIEACDLLDVDPRASVAIEDSSVGVRAAVASGCLTVACPGPLTVGHDLSAAHLVVESHHDITLARLADALARRSLDVTA